MRCDVSEPKKYVFRGGSMDGRSIEIGNVIPGMKRAGPTLDNGQREWYELDLNDEFKFTGYSRGENLAAMHPDILEKTTPIIAKLLPILAELDKVYEECGGPDSSPMTVGNWRLTPADA